MKAHSVTLHGTLNPNGLDTHYWFEYDTEEYKEGEGAHGTKVPLSPADVGSGTSNVAVSQSISSGLSVGTTYYFRLVGENAEATVNGGQWSFKTAGLPVATTEAATGVTETEATLNATVNPERAETKYFFEYGPTTSYGSKTAEASAGSGTTNVHVAQTITGLTHGTTYHFRVVTTNEVGLTDGKDLTFKSTSWSLQTTPNPPPKTENKTPSVSCASSTMCMSVGRNRFAKDSFRQTWNGTEWKLIEPYVSGEVEGVSCPTTTWCMSVGQATWDQSDAWISTESGGSWKTSEKEPPAPSGALSSKLRSISCTSTTACTAVGYYRNEKAEYKPLAERWNGTSWSIQTAPGTGYGFYTMMNVSCASSTSCMAVGRETSAHSEYWNGTEWSVKTVPSPGGSEPILEGVSCTSSSACMAVGYYAEGSVYYKGFSEKWNGSSWTLQATAIPAESEGGNELFGVSCQSASSCFAVGGRFNKDTEPFSGYHAPAEERTLSEYWNGTSWSVQTTPNPEKNLFDAFGSISCTSSTACTAVGTTGASSSPWEGESSTLGERYNGTSWSLQTTPNPPPKTENKTPSVSCASSTMCMSVGRNRFAKDSFRQTWNGTEWKLIEPYVSGEVEGVSCPTTTWCMSVGQATWDQSDAWISTESGGSWKTSEKEPPAPSGALSSKLRSISCTSTTACTAVGYYRNEKAEYKPLAERWNGTSWSIQTAPGTGYGFYTMMNVSCASSTSCMAVGRETSAHSEYWNGTEWSVKTVPSPGGSEPILEGVSCTSSSACMAVGYYAEGSVYYKGFSEKWNGSSWTLQATAIPAESEGGNELFGVSCQSASSCFAVGGRFNKDTEPFSGYHAPAEERTLSEYWNGTSWSVQTTPNPEKNLFDAFGSISCTSSTACTAVGTTGASSSPWEGESSTLGERYE